MALEIKKAQRTQAKMRLLLSWASGSGKTYSALRLGKGLCKWDMSKVCVIDTEHNSASLYSDLWDYSVLQLDPDNCTTDLLCEAFDTIENAWFEVIVWDSSTHFWNFCLEKNDQFTKQNYWNSFTSRRQTNKYYIKMINRMLSSKCHVIATARSKSDYVIETNDKWKTQIKKVWLKAEARWWFDFEFTVCLDINEMHMVDKVAKDRTWIFATREEPFQITEQTGIEILDWCETWMIPQSEPQLKVQPQLASTSLPPIDDERFGKACWVIQKGDATLDSLLEHFTLSANQKAIIKEMFWKEVA